MAGFRRAQRQYLAGQRTQRTSASRDRPPHVGRHPTPRDRQLLPRDYKYCDYVSVVKDLSGSVLSAV